MSAAWKGKFSIRGETAADLPPTLGLPTLKEQELMESIKELRAELAAQRGRLADLEAQQKAKSLERETLLLRVQTLEDSRQEQSTAAATRWTEEMTAMRAEMETLRSEMKHSKTPSLLPAMGAGGLETVLVTNGILQTAGDEGDKVSKMVFNKPRRRRAKSFEKVQEEWAKIESTRLTEGSTSLTMANGLQSNSGLGSRQQQGTKRKDSSLQPDTPGSAKERAPVEADFTMQVDQSNPLGWDSGDKGWDSDNQKTTSNVVQQGTSYAETVRGNKGGRENGEYKTVLSKKDQKQVSKSAEKVDEKAAEANKDKGKQAELSRRQLLAQKVRELVPPWKGESGVEGTPAERLARLFKEDTVRRRVTSMAGEEAELPSRRQSEEVVVFRMAAPLLNAECRASAKEALKVICREMGRPANVQWTFLDTMLVSPTSAEFFIPATQGPLFKETMGKYLIPEDQIQLGELDLQRRAGVYRGGYFLGLRQAALHGLTKDLQIRLLEQLLEQPEPPSKHRNLRASVLHDLGEIRKRSAAELPME